MTAVLILKIRVATVLKPLLFMQKKTFLALVEKIALPVKHSIPVLTAILFTR